MKIKVLNTSFILNIILSVALSWIYVFCAQFIMPFGTVPIYLLPLPLFIAVDLFGVIGVYSWIFYIIQGMIGLPVFSAGRFGITHLCGPTGGYIFGMFFAASFLFLVKENEEYWIAKLIKLFFAMTIIYVIGLLQLSLFVPFKQLFIVGLYPFIFGDFLKILFCLFISGLKR